MLERGKGRNPTLGLRASPAATRRRACISVAVRFAPVVAAASLALPASSAFASISVFGSIGSADVGAVADDPSLANDYVYDVSVSLSAGDRFNSADLLAQLSAGTFYIPPGDGADSNLIMPWAVRDAVGTRYFRDDTFVCVPLSSRSRTLITGPSALSQTQSPDAIFPSNGHNSFDVTGAAFVPANAMNTVSVAFHDVDPAANTTYATPGSYMIARLVFPKTGAGTVRGSVTSLAATSAQIPFYLEMSPFTYWLRAGGGTWSAGANWNNGYAPGDGGVVYFNRNAAAPYAVDLDADRADEIQIQSDRVAIDLHGHTLTSPLGVVAGSLDLSDGSFSGAVRIGSRLTQTAFGQSTGVGALRVLAGASGDVDSVRVGEPDLPGSLTIAGSSARLNVRTAAGVDVPTGTIQISSGGSLSVAGDVRLWPGAPAAGVDRRSVMTIDGPGSRLSTTGSLSLDSGRAEPAAQVNISNGATAAVGGTLYVNNYARLTLAGGAITAAKVQVNNHGECVVQPSAAVANVVCADQFIIDATSRFDLGDGRMIIGSAALPSAATSVRAALQSGYAYGAWNGAGGITSSLAGAASQGRCGVGYARALDLSIATFAGRPIDPKQIAVRYTLNGDTNLDGAVDLFDFTVLAANFSRSDGRTWINGDCTYDGSVDLADFTMLATNFGHSVGTVGDNVVSAALAPEPASVLSLAVASSAFASRRMRHRDTEAQRNARNESERSKVDD